MPVGEYNHPLFGLVRFETKNKTKWVFGDRIKFTAGFDDSDVIDVNVPQLSGVEGGGNGDVKFHKRGKKQLLAAFEDIERLGLLSHINQTAGAYYPRLRKPVSGNLSKLPSNHSFGIAVDLNSNDGCLGCTTEPLASVFEAHGFLWGKAFNDPMHYEISKFIDNDEPSVKDIKLSINDKMVPNGAKNIFGDAFIDTAALDHVPGLSVVGESESDISVAGASGGEILKKLTFGGLSFISLPQVLGLAGLTSEFTNSKKTMKAKPIDDKS